MIWHVLVLLLLMMAAVSDAELVKVGQPDLAGT